MIKAQLSVTGHDSYDRKFIERIVGVVRRTTEEDMKGAPERDWQDWEAQLVELRSVLRNLSSSTIGLLLMAMETSVSWQCECGRIIEVAGDRRVTVRGKPHGLPPHEA